MRKRLDVPSEAACAASIMKTHYSRTDEEKEDLEDDILDIGFVNYAEDAVEENERYVLTAHISSRLESDPMEDVTAIPYAADDSHTAKAFEIHKI